MEIDAYYRLVEGGKEGVRQRIGDAAREQLRVQNADSFPAKEAAWELPTGTYAAILRGDFTVIRGTEAIVSLCRSFGIDCGEVLGLPALSMNSVRALVTDAEDAGNHVSVHHEPPTEEEERDKQQEVKLRWIARARIVEVIFNNM